MHLDVGTWFAALIDWLLANFGWFFNAVSWLINLLVGEVANVLIGLHPFLIIALLVAAAAGLTRSVGLSVFSVLAFLLIYSMGLWTDSMSTLAVVLVSVVFSLAIGIPLGIWAALNNTVSKVVRPILDLMQAMPVFVYLIPAVFFFGVGMVPGIAATIVFAIPPAVRLTELGIRKLDVELLEAATAFGAKRSLVLKDVQLPLAFPSIMAGVNQVIMLALSMVVVAGLVGAGGLGGVVVQGVAQLDTARGFEGGLAVVILAVYLDRVTGGAQSLGDVLRRRRVRKEQRAAATTTPAAAREAATTAAN
ncbi:MULTISPECIES: proline/glycine betaine ABC transporter permease [Arthrobacter]|uniref:ABC transporter permease subunit n=1 Tax=Arthrobacter terricola TaxID=2547396 RepID=A0A4R5KES8_9MICC|nr:MULTISPECIES: ABC transporter permease subunit [Arthrobacter]MBT8162090.1 ABC transporter permease subunit [Arthrobacter sp. GN70]TDF93909.1 ABC transporter permease subunit [Arthrobacter terricola]